MTYLKLFIILSFIVLTACQSNTNKSTAPKDIINRVLKTHGSAIFDKSIVEFKIGKTNFKSSRKDGKFRYERFWDEYGTIMHVEQTIDQIRRTVGQTEIIMDAKKILENKKLMHNDFYLFSLPFGLQEKGLSIDYVGEVVIGDQNYLKLKASRKQDPLETEKINLDSYYWINKEKNTLDYLAYQSANNNIFLKAMNQRTVNGLLVQDYMVFKSFDDTMQVSLDEMDIAFNKKFVKSTASILHNDIRLRPSK